MHDVTIQPHETDTILQEAEYQQVKLRNELESLKAEYRDFVYAVTHDLTGPFRQIEGFANIILSNHGDQFDDKTKRQFDLIIGGSEKGKEILEALLGYSRLITSNLSYTAVDCTQLIDDVIAELSLLIEPTGADIQFKDSKNSISSIIYGDRDQLYQLMYHIVHNALHYRKSTESPRVVIKTKELEQEWQFCITDNGIGIRDKMTERLFNPLKRGVAEKDYSGIGMGLTIAKSIVKRHGGKIWLTSEPGTGSSFYFTLRKERRDD